MKWVNLKDESQYAQFLYPGLMFDGVDPHLVWAAVSYFTRANYFSECPIPVMFEAKTISGKVKMPDLRPPSLINLTAGTQYVNRKSRFFTGFVTPSNLGLLGSQVERLRIGVVGLPSTDRQHEPAPPIKNFKDHPNKDEVVIGIIDHGIGFLNRQFATKPAGKWESRIERIWDQQRGYPCPPLNYGAAVGVGKVWKTTKHFAYGRELVNTGKVKQINHWLNQPLSEAEIYRLLQYRPAQGAATHGTHVLGLAGGNRAYVNSVHGNPVQFLGDEAAKAAIIAVQLPALPYKDTSGTGLCVQILDAISYIHLHAAGRKVVINLSDGAYAGPHDGTSLLERAIDDFFDRAPDRNALVVAAGNQFNERVHWQNEIKSNSTEVLTWSILPDDNTDSHLEIWPDTNLTEEHLKKLKIRVTPPGRAVLADVGFGQANALFDNGNLANEPAIAMVAFVRNPPNAVSSNPIETPRAMVHIAVAATTPLHRSNQVAAPHGLWQIEFINEGAELVNFNAYIERDNPALGDAGPSRQSHFVHPSYPRDTGRDPIIDDSKNSSPIRHMGALNNVATAKRIEVVGGVVVNIDSNGTSHPRIATYSASGPGRGGPEPRGVDRLKPSDTSNSIRGIRGYATRSGTSFRMDGTSVAAPQVTRVRVNLMAGESTESRNQGISNSNKYVKPIEVIGPPERVGAGLED